MYTVYKLAIILMHADHLRTYNKLEIVGKHISAYVTDKQIRRGLYSYLISPLMYLL